MFKKINTKTIKLIKFYKLINYNLIYNNKAINRYKNNNNEITTDESIRLEKLNCIAKKNLANLIKLLI